MPTIDIYKYKIDETKNSIYKEPVKLFISQESYDETKNDLVLDITTTINFRNVIFESAIYLDEGDKMDEEIFIDFYYCIIKSLDLNFMPIKSPNIHIRLYNCIIKNFDSGSSKLKGLTIRNSFGRFIIKKVENLVVSYSERYLSIKGWRKLNTRLDMTTILSYQTFFSIEEVQKVYVSGEEFSFNEKKNMHKRNNFFLIKTGKRSRLMRFLSEEEKNLFKLSLTFKYQVDFEHKETIINNLPITQLFLSGKPNGDVKIEDCKIDNINLLFFSPKTSFSLINITSRIGKQARFKVIKSILDNTEFNSVKLNNYKIIFSKSSFVNTKFYSTIFPDIRELLDSNKFSSMPSTKERENENDYNRDMYELFLELKQAFDKRGNVFESQKMKAVAHEFLYRMERWDLSKSDFWNNKLILSLNRLSNFYGISIKRAFLWLVLMIIIFHGFNIISYNSYILGFNDIGEFIDIVEETIRYLFVIANPTHKISSLAPEGEITEYTYVVSFLSRICIGYMYYQFITAFRRFGK